MFPSPDLPKSSCSCSVTDSLPGKRELRCNSSLLPLVLYEFPCSFLRDPTLPWMCLQSFRQPGVCWKALNALTQLSPRFFFDFSDVAVEGPLLQHTASLEALLALRGKFLFYASMRFLVSCPINSPSQSYFFGAERYPLSPFLRSSLKEFQLSDCDMLSTPSLDHLTSTIMCVWSNRSNLSQI